jgi:hypothetical protein
MKGLLFSVLGSCFCAQSVATAGEEGDGGGHLEVEEGGVDLAEGEIGDDAESLGGFALAAGGAEGFDEGRLFGRFAVEEFELDGLRVVFRFPIHEAHQVVGAGDEFGAVVAHEVKAAATVLIVGAAGEGADGAVVVGGEVGGDERSALFGTFDHEGDIGQSGDNAVAAHEVAGEGAHAGDVLGEESAVAEHVAGGVAVRGGVEGVEPVCQDADGVEPVVEGGAVGVDVDPIGESAHDEGIGEGFGQFGTAAFAVGFAVGGDAARAHDRHDVARVEIGRAAIVDHGGGVGTFGQSPRIVVGAEGEGADAVAPAELEFVGCPTQGFFSTFGEEMKQLCAGSRDELVERVECGGCVLKQCPRMADVSQEVDALRLGESAQQAEGDVMEHGLGD